MTDDQHDGHAAPPATGKADLRRLVSNRRRAMTPVARRSAAAGLTRALTDLTVDERALSVACFVSRPSEPDTSAFIAWALEQHIEVFLPVSLPGAALNWVRYDGRPFVPGRHGIAEPAGDRLPGDVLGGVDLAFLPACAVDHGGTRLGWGLGYYDRCLGSLDRLPPRYAVVFDDDVFDAVPHDPHDVPMTGVVTEAGVRRFSTLNG